MYLLSSLIVVTANCCVPRKLECQKACYVTVAASKFVTVFSCGITAYFKGFLNIVLSQFVYRIYLKCAYDLKCQKSNVEVY